MDHISPQVVFVIFALLGLGVIWNYYARTEKDKYLQFYQSIAAQWNGKVVLPNDNLYPILYFPYLKTEISVFMTPQSVEAEQATHVFADLGEETEYQFCIFKQHNFERLDKYDKLQDIHLGQEAVDTSFRVKGNNEIFINWLFEGDVAQYFTRIKGLDPVVEFHQNQFSISVPQFILNEATLKLLVETAKVFIKRLQELGEYQCQVNRKLPLSREPIGVSDSKSAASSSGKGLLLF